MTKKVIKKAIIIILIATTVLSAAFYGLYRIAEHVGDERTQNALENAREFHFPDAFVKLNEKFGNDLEVVDATFRSEFEVVYRNSSEFENKYNVDGKTTEEFLQDIADEWYDCFRDELAVMIEESKDMKYYERGIPNPLIVAFQLDNGEYERIYFSYDYTEPNKCDVVYINYGR